MKRLFRKSVWACPPCLAMAAVLCILLQACNRSATSPAVPILKVNLETDSPGVDELFSRIEVVPLEESDSSLVMRLTRVLPYKDKLFVVDRKIPACFLFDKDGNFIRQVGRMGNGPGEYYQIEDGFVDESRQEFSLLDCNGIWFVYDLDGKYLRKQWLSDGGACQSLVQAQDGYFAFWFLTQKDREAIRLFDTAGQYVKGYWHQPFQFNFMLFKPFYRYDGKAYFSTACYPSVYELSADTLREVYRWDFGDKGIDPQVVQIIAESDESGPDDGYDKAGKFLFEGRLAFVQQNQYQTDRYYYVQLMKVRNEQWLFTNVFYDKRNGHSWVFDKVKEGFPVSPLFMNDEYLLTTVAYKDFGLLKSVLPAEEYAKLEALDEESNPCLLRMYFK